MGTLLAIARVRRVSFARVLQIGVLCILLLSMAVGEVAAQVTPPGVDTSLVGKLKSGGYNLYVRHAATDWSQSDRIRAHGDWTSCDPDRIRQLSDEGRRTARKVGAALQLLGIRLGRVFASPYCRTMETAKLMSGRAAEPTTDLLNLRAASFVGGGEAVVARARRLLSEPPEAGVNDLFVAHGNLGRAATDTGLAEGELLVVAPRGDGRFDAVGTLTPAALMALVGQ